MSEITPTLHESVSIINNCDTVTLFDIGLRCNVERIPSTSTSNDGILSIVITGGTSPYTVYWNNIQGPQRLINVGQGSYPVTVVDYYGDYTASTICSLIAPTATPAPTPPPTPLPTPITYPNFLCFVYQSSTTTYGPIQFFWNGSTSNVNGKPTWSGTYNGANLSLVWTLQPPRWEINGWNSIPGWNQSQGIPVSTSTSNVPLTNWSIVGGQPATTTMSQGVCPPFVALRAFVEKQDSTCPNRNNGSITITADAGQGPYMYSIDGGITYVSTNIFDKLAPKTYPVVVKDSLNNVTAVIPTQIGIINPTPLNYTFAINQIGGSGGNSTGLSNNTTFEWQLDIQPPLALGQVVEVIISMQTTNELFEPGSGIMTNTYSLNKNGTAIPTTTSVVGANTIQRSGCSSDIVSIIENCGAITITVGYNDTIGGSVTSNATITNPQVNSGGCATKLKQTSMVTLINTSTSPAIKFISGFTSCETISGVDLFGLINEVP